MRRGEREYAYKKEKERERASRVADLCVGWAPDTGVWPAGSLPIGASWIQSLKTIIWTECMRACVCMCVCVGGENIYLSGCTWATVTNYFPLTLSFIMKYTNCLHVFSQAKHTHTHTHIRSHCMQRAKPSLASSTSWDFKGDPLSVALSQFPRSPFLSHTNLTHTQSINS